MSVEKRLLEREEQRMLNAKREQATTSATIIGGVKKVWRQNSAYLVDATTRKRIVLLFFALVCEFIRKNFL